MTLISKILLAGSVLTSLALAAPVVNPRAIVWDIVTETVWTTLDHPNSRYSGKHTKSHFSHAPPLPTASLVPMNSEAPSAPTAQPLAPSFASSPPSSSTGDAGQFYTAPVPSVAPSTPAAVEESTTPLVMATAPAVTPAPAAAAVPTSAPPPAMSSAAAAADVSSSSTPVTASTTGTCEGESNACVGDVTHWDGGLGACGTDVDTTNDLAIALPFEFMGTLSNTNPYCGRSVTLLNPTSGTTVQATVRDKCMGCVDRAIDCTDKLFDAITDGLGNGRMSGIEWWLN